MTDRLDDYRKRRDFSATREPAGERTRKVGKGKPIFVVQLHHASHRHFDFRLQVDGTLRSWAVPKGPSRDPSDKRLAVQVEDHPLSYADFEGSIPAGSYGAGVVEIWDRGSYTCEGDADEALKEGHLHFTLRGKRLKGDWALVRSGRGKKQWLLIKVKDKYTRRGDDAAAQSAQDEERPVTRLGDAFELHDYGVQLATLSPTAPRGREWIHEVKYDGYRVLVARNGRRVRAISRNAQDWSRKLAHVAAAAVKLDCRNCILDGELVMWDDDGRSSFGKLQQAFGGHGIGKAELMCFDLLHLDGKDLRGKPQRGRRKKLEALLDGAERPLRLSQMLKGPARDVLAAACEHKLEGIISKDPDAAYQAGRNRHWLKSKCTGGDEFLAIGYTRGQGARARLGSLLLATWRDGSWHYTGRAGSGLDENTIARLLKLPTRQQPPNNIATLPDKAQLRGAKPVWLVRQPVVEINFRGRTRGGLLRQPSVKGVRMDKTAKDLRGPGDRGNDDSSKQGVTLTHPDKPLFDDPRITKADLADYYAELAPRMLAELRGRPVSVVRCPDGIGADCFFQKHAMAGLDEAVKRIEIQDSDGESATYLCVDDAAGLRALVQMGGIELHVWGSQRGDLEHPDRLVFDLDPAPDVDFARLKKAAALVHERLEGLKLKSWLRTTGGKGLHLVVPLTPDADWEEVKSFAHAVADALAAENPKQFLAKASKSARKGKIFIDYLRNARGATAIANYSVRARPGAPVATPLRWDELARLRSADPYTLKTIPRRLAQLKADPWKGIGRARQTLPALEDL